MILLMVTVLYQCTLSCDSVAMVTKKKVDKDEDTASIVDSAFGTASVSGATFTGTKFSEVSCSIHTRTEYRCEVTLSLPINVH